MPKALKMNEKDNVATVLDDINQGEAVSVTFNGNHEMTVIANEAMDCYHKIAINGIANEAAVFKYGEVIGKATKDISPGDHVHINNIESVMTK